jgi:hypothetical protein
MELHENIDKDFPAMDCTSFLHNKKVMKIKPRWFYRSRSELEKFIFIIYQSRAEGPAS